MKSMSANLQAISIIVVNLQDNRAVFRNFIALLNFSFDPPSYIYVKAEILYEHWLKISPSCLCLCVSESAFGHPHWFTEILVQRVCHLRAPLSHTFQFSAIGKNNMLGARNQPEATLAPITLWSLKDIE